MMAGNGLGADGAKALAPVLAHLTQLKYLYLYGECRADMIGVDFWGAGTVSAVVAVARLPVVYRVEVGGWVWRGRAFEV